MKYRSHRGSLFDAMATAVDLAGRDELIGHLQADLAHWGYKVTTDDVRLEHQGFDARIGWDTYLVLIRNQEVSPGRWFFGGSVEPGYFGVIGYTDGPAGE